MTKLNVACIVADTTDHWFDLSVQSALPVADRFVFIIDKPDAHTWSVIEKAQETKQVIIIHKKYEHESKQADGMQRTAYLEWLKKNAEGEFALVLDTDEVLSDNCTDLFKYMQEEACWNVRMRHVWYGLGLEDATVEKHYVPRRFFKIIPTLSYPLVEHPILTGHDAVLQVDDVCIWHMNVVKGVLEELRKYKVQCKKSNIHGPEQLLNWHKMHVLGGGIIKQFDTSTLPKIVKEYCCIGERGESVLHGENRLCNVLGF